jgi:hypothetical protein
VSLQPNTWRENLEQLFAATVNQQTLDEAVDLMVSVSAGDDSYHVDCLAALDQGIHAADDGDSSVIDAINKSGYQVKTTDAAAGLLRDFKAIYLAAYGRIRA